MAIQIEYNNDCLRVVFSDTVDINETNKMLDEIEPLERVRALKCLDRIADLRLVKKFDLNYSHVYNIAQRRKLIKFRERFKSALVVNSDYAMGFARMFQTVNDHPDIDMQIFKTIEDAEEWIKTKMTKQERRMSNIE